MNRAKEEGSRLWPLYKARCADLRAAKKLERARVADLEALKAENVSLRARAEAAEMKAELAVRQRSKLQELLDQKQTRNERVDSSSEEGIGVSFGGFGRGRSLRGPR